MDSDLDLTEVFDILEDATYTNFIEVLNFLKEACITNEDIAEDYKLKRELASAHQAMRRAAGHLKAVKKLHDEGVQ